MCGGCRGLQVLFDQGSGNYIHTCNIHLIYICIQTCMHTCVYIYTRYGFMLCQPGHSDLHLYGMITCMLAAGKDRSYHNNPGT